MLDEHEFWSIEEHFIKPRRWHMAVWRYPKKQEALDRRKFLVDKCGVSSRDVRVVRWRGEIEEVDDA